MKRLLLAIFAATVSFSALPALADPPTPAPECKIDEINQRIDAAVELIRQSPAYGQAGGHYGTAIKGLRKAKDQLSHGCERWTQDQNK